MERVAAAAERLQAHKSLDEAERGLETNVDAAALHVNLAYALASLQLLRQRAGGQLRKDDPLLRLMKKIQERSGRLAQMRKKVEAGSSPALEKREKGAV